MTQKPTYTYGDILEPAGHHAIVNPVNCVGAMGAGLARAFATAHPSCVPPYAAACRDGTLRPGTVLIHHLTRACPPFHVVLFPTKLHWRNPSRIEWIEQGLEDMYAKLSALSVPSVAIPALGSGLGGLPWTRADAAIRAAAHRHPSIQTTIFLPRQTQRNRKNQ